jgi:NAD(P)-dependent dehydrogenase (short-subunit alcohol dehydrogenase family)
MVVGASRGIGRAAAELFAAAGARLVLAARDGAELFRVESALERGWGAGALSVPTDATRAEDVGWLVAETVARFGRIDKLVYTAGAPGPFQETTEEEFERLFAVNVRGAFLLCRAVLPGMERQRSGHVVAVPGILGRAPMAQAAAYCASKYALTGMLKSLALETKRAGVRISLLHLGGVNSGFWDTISMRVQRERTLTIDATARAVFFAATQEGEGVLNEIVLQPESHQMLGLI